MFNEVRSLDTKIKRIDYSSIAVWFSTGFFLGNKHFYSDKIYEPTNLGPNFEWFYNPRDISFNQAVDEFADLFESLIKNKVKGKKIILPISGGLDSRTIAAALSKKKNNIVAISYEFEGGIKETEYAKRIAEILDWEFHSFTIPNGYLWGKLSEISLINNCLIDFTYSRQAAVIDQISYYGDLLISGQWGDVLFDNPGIKSNANLKDQIRFITKKIVKPSGFELASALWRYWDIEGRFENELNKEIMNHLSDIKISNPISRVRAFKSIHWANRWANEGLKIFTRRNEMFIPYYSNEICEFICTVPEKYLADRKIQIEYIKRKSPELARVLWQKYDMNLYKYKYFNSIYYPLRISRYLNRIFKEKLLNIPSIIERNWELQFLGKENDIQLKKWLFDNPELNKIVPNNIVEDFYNKFKYVNKIKYSHSIGMLLSLSVWTKKFWRQK